MNCFTLNVLFRRTTLRPTRESAGKRTTGVGHSPFPPAGPHCAEDQKAKGSAYAFAGQVYSCIVMVYIIPR